MKKKTIDFNKSIEFVKDYLNPNSQRCQKWGTKIAIFNKFIFLSLILWNLPNMVERLNKNIKDKLLIVIIHFTIRILLPLMISIISKPITIIYDFFSKHYIFQLIICIILIVCVVFSYSRDLVWKL